MKKYYFITIAAVRSNNLGVLYIHSCIAHSPMEHVSELNKSLREQLRKDNVRNYINYGLVNSLEITEEEYQRWFNDFV